MASAKIPFSPNPSEAQRVSALDPHEAFVSTGQSNRLVARFPCDNGAQRDEEPVASSEPPEDLANSGPTWAAEPLPNLNAQRNSAALAVGLPGGIVLPTGLRRITAAERGVATPVFGTSLNFVRILISDGLGGFGRPFTAFVKLPLLGGFVVLNCGPGFSGTGNPDLFIHELTHAWQSQHHPNPFQFMVNSAASQALAAATGKDAYKYTTGKSFGEYAAEQIAEQVEDGITAIRSHVKSVIVGLPDLANILSLAVPRAE